MKQATRSWHLLAAALLLAMLLLQQKQADAAAPNANNTNTNAEQSNTVKKDQPAPPAATAINSAKEDGVLQPPAEAAAAVNDKAVVISEKSQQPPPVAVNETPEAILPEEDVHIEHTNRNNNEDFPETFTAVYYILVGVTSSAILLLILRVYRLRLSRAERKYGVQGDRANQELTPLPMAIEDVNSDEEEDHTVFEVNRHSIRIL